MNTRWAKATALFAIPVAGTVLAVWYLWRTRQ